MIRDRRTELEIFLMVWILIKYYKLYKMKYIFLLKKTSQNEDSARSFKGHREWITVHAVSISFSSN